MDLKKKFRTFVKIIGKYGISGLPYSFMLTLHLLYRTHLKNKITKMGAKGIVIELENKKLMLLDPYDLGLSYDILLNEKKLRENYASEYLLSNLNKDGGVFFDLGANLGYYTILLSDYFRKIICVEPVENNVKFIEKNVLINNLHKKAHIINCAVAPNNGKVYFEDNERKNLVQISKKMQGNIINAYTIETICKKSGVPSIDFLKMDLEGYEYEIIVDGNESFTKYAPRKIFVEVHFDILGRDRSEQLLMTLHKNGYVIEAAFIEVKEMLYWLKGPIRDIYAWYVEKFLIGKKMGLLYENTEISKVLEDKDIMDARVGAIEFIFKKNTK